MRLLNRLQYFHGRFQRFGLAAVLQNIFSPQSCAPYCAYLAFLPLYWESENVCNYFNLVDPVPSFHARGLLSFTEVFTLVAPSPGATVDASVGLAVTIVLPCPRCLLRVAAVALCRARTAMIINNTHNILISTSVCSTYVFEKAYQKTLATGSKE